MLPQYAADALVICVSLQFSVSRPLDEFTFSERSVVLHELGFRQLRHRPKFWPIAAMVRGDCVATSEAGVGERVHVSQGVPDRCSRRKKTGD